MPREPHNQDEALRAQAARELAALSAEQVTLPEAILNASPEAAARIADTVPRPAATVAAVRRADETTVPTPRQWDQVWGQIVGGAQERQSGRVLRLATVLTQKRWRAVAAIAACLLLAVVWQFTTPAAVPAVEPWPVQLAMSVDINDFEVYDDATPMIIAGDGATSAPILWVLENGS